MGVTSKYTTEYVVFPINEVRMRFVAVGCRIFPPIGSSHQKQARYRYDARLENAFVNNVLEFRQKDKEQKTNPNRAFENNIIKELLL